MCLGGGRHRRQGTGGALHQWRLYKKGTDGALDQWLPYKKGTDRALRQWLPNKQGKGGALHSDCPTSKEHMRPCIRGCPTSFYWPTLFYSPKLPAPFFSSTVFLFSSFVLWVGIVGLGSSDGQGFNRSLPTLHSLTF